MKQIRKLLILIISVTVISVNLYSQKPSEQNHFRSNYSSLTKTKQAVNSLVYRSLISLSYLEVLSSDNYKTSAFVRSFSKSVSANEVRTIDIVINKHPDGGYEIFLYGRSGASLINPDIAIIASTAEQIFSAKTVSAQEEYAYEVYYCSYISSDRAVGMLKGLGYNVVEFSTSKGSLENETFYQPIFDASISLPYIIKMLDAPKTSLMDPSPSEQMQTSQRNEGSMAGIPEIGGTYLHQATPGETQQRLLLVYDKNELEGLQTLLSLLRDKIDKPARQIVMEALVIEMNMNDVKDLGVETGWSDNNKSVQSSKFDDYGNITPFTFIFEKDAVNQAKFKTTIKTLISQGKAEVLSNPSVLVLDGRQARIQVGQQVPVSQSTSVQGATTQSVSYIPVGIVLNLRPRISEDETEITMQVETIVSAVDKSAVIPTPTGQQSVLLAPTIDNRQVQTFVRISNNTPFIIGGLISSEKSTRQTGIPFLMDIPYVGWIFGSTKDQTIKKEVIIVLTPHIVPVQEKNFSYVIPKDDKIFDSFEHTLFRNAYRVRNNDVYDLNFITEAIQVKKIQKEFTDKVASNPLLENNPSVKNIIKGNIPGEDVLVKRMLWDIVRKLKYYENVPAEKIIIFTPDKDPSQFKLTFLDQELTKLRGSQTLLLNFQKESLTSSSKPFTQPTANLVVDKSKELLQNGNGYVSALRLQNNNKAVAPVIAINSTTMFGGLSTIDVLKAVLVIRRILQLNSDLSLTIAGMYTGKQILFPAVDDLQTRFHVVDGETAELYYDICDYYYSFEKKFQNEINQLRATTK